MPYIGNNPTTQFASLDYQDLTGVTGVPAKRGYTLNSAVGSANDIEVFVNNVRQEPGVAYTVSGTTLTMTGDVETTDDFYVVFQGKAVGTASHPAGNALEATSGTFTGDVSISGGGLTVEDGGSSTNSLDITYNGTSGVANIQADSNGGSTTLNFGTSNSGVVANRLSILSSGDVNIVDGNLVFASGHGIDFSATANTSATGASTNSELLDDYEEGTWTPAIAGSSDVGTATYSSQVGRYTKVGSLVTITGYVNWSSHTGTGTMKMIGIPFVTTQSSSSVFNSLGGSGIMHNGITLSSGYTQLSLYYPAYSSNTYLEIYQSGSGVAWGQVDMSASGQFIFVFTYNIN